MNAQSKLKADQWHVVEFPAILPSQANLSGQSIGS